MVECLTIGPRVRASPASLRCVLEQDTGSTQEDKPNIAVRLLMGRKESNQTEKTTSFLSSCLRDTLILQILYIYNLGLVFRIYIVYPRTRNTGNILNDTSACLLGRLENDFAR